MEVRQERDRMQSEGSIPQVAQVVGAGGVSGDHSVITAGGFLFAAGDIRLAADRAAKLGTPLEADELDALMLHMQRERQSHIRACALTVPEWNALRRHLR